MLKKTYYLVIKNQKCINNSLYYFIKRVLSSEAKKMRELNHKSWSLRYSKSHSQKDNSLKLKMASKILNESGKYIKRNRAYEVKRNGVST